MRTFRWLAASASLTLVLSGPAPATAQPGGALPGDTVTLVTGDVVRFSGDKVVSVEPGKGRDRIGFAAERRAGHQYIYPSDVLGLLAAGRVDRRLFDVTGLLAIGYRDTTPLILQHAGGAKRSSLRQLADKRATVTREIPVVNALAVRADKGDNGALWTELRSGLDQGAVRSILLDGVRQIALDQSAAQIGAPAAWEAGLTGRDVVVGVLDTGVDASHPDLAGRIRASENFSESPEPGDVIGHGTHVASTMAGNGAASGGRYKGIAPEATILAGKVCDDRWCSDSAMIAGMQWAAEQGASVVNVSIGGPDSPGVDIVEDTVNRLSAQYGTLFVIASGNDGPHTVQSPSTADAALSVAAVDRQDAIADFSSGGPRLGDGGLKPEIAAPGTDIVAARSSLVPDEGSGPYMARSGTSMATPHVAGAAALLAQKYPQWSGSELKGALMSTSRWLDGVALDGQGAGRVDLAALVSASVVVDQGSLNLGRPEWPHEDDAPMAKVLTYRNTGTTPISATVAGAMTGPGGAAPAGMLTVSPSTVTIPAGGTATVTVTVDTSVAAPDGRYTGQVTAMVGATPVRTQVSVFREAESYDITVRVIDRHGATATAYNSAVTSWTGEQVSYQMTPDGYTTRVPAGDYSVGALIATDPDTEKETISLLARPQIRLKADTTVVIDARTAAAVDITVPEPGAAPVLSLASYTAPGDDGLDYYFPYEGTQRLFLGQVGPAATSAGFKSLVASHWARSDGNGSFWDSPYMYNVGIGIDGGVPTGLTRHVRPRDLAVVHQNMHGLPGTAGAMGSLADNAFFSANIRMRLPARRIDYFAGTNVNWSSDMVDIGPIDVPKTVTLAAQSDLVYRPGRSYQQIWNTAVFGPAFYNRPAGSASTVGVTRTADDEFSAYFGMMVDPVPGRFGIGGKIPAKRSQTTLYRNGEPIATSPVAGILSTTLPSEDSAYRLEAELDRTGVFPTSTKVSGSWSFRSAHSAEAVTPLPLMTVHYAPALDGAYSAPAGERFTIPVRVSHQAGSHASRVTSLTVEVSYDDGATWSPAAVKGGGSKWKTTVNHPAGAEHVSLRAVAKDKAGNEVTLTTLRAYLLH
ncbi:S8 family serine peptidase [Phytohabitans aurantiacus]|uniref:Serine protease n=1 Tax=Phytohabitans aurantiacus TaxID=3016789 RepID=A0ABQ5QPP7_9ACTN|nr:S8 family serine peptidase [Phytohabitans aurantiacus]GLH95714.1 serine protease [Phytohabitans aurantiacus]